MSTLKTKGDKLSLFGIIALYSLYLRAKDVELTSGPMIKHIVLFRLKDFAEGADKRTNAEKIKKELEALPGKIPEIKEYVIGINEKESPRASDVAVVSAFESWEDLAKYSACPEHRKVVDFINKVSVETRACDFEY